MDDISQQLKNEIHSLESYIERTEDRLLATHWSAALLDPLEADAPGLSDDDLKAALLVLQRAKAKFDVNGRVGTRIDGVLEKFAPLLPAPLQEGIEDEEADADLVVSADVSTDSDAFTEIADSLFEEEEEEEFEDPDELFDDREEAEEAMAETSPDPALFDFGDDESPLSSPAFTSLDLTEDDVEGSVDAIHPLPATPAAQPAAPAFEGFSEVEPAVGGSSDDLFASEVEAGALPQSSSSGAAGTAREGLPRSRSEGDEEGTREARSRPPEQRDTEVDIFSHKISLEDIQAALDLTLQGEDVVPLQQRLRAKLSDKVVAGLRASKVAEKQFILIPRIARFVHKGVSQPCTVLTLAKAFPAMFGQLQELARYRGSAFMTSETPEPGWALISQEAPRESIGKNYMEQNQYLRYLATSLGIPSHMIRRRTLVEAVYDLLVARLALGLHLQRQTLDWTSTTPTKNDFICVYFAEEGLRVRDLTRTTRHRSLGVCPNW